MDRMHHLGRRGVLARPNANQLVWFVLFVFVLSLLFVAGAAAQYGGVSGIFVSQNPNNPHNISIEGVGCAGGSEVVIYLPALAATDDDPDALTPVPGRIIAVTAAITSEDPTIDGTFSFDNLDLPAELAPGEYAIHARCGDQDIESLFVIPVQVAQTTTTTTALATPNAGVGQLPITGASSQRGAAFAAALMGLGAFFVVFARKTSTS